MLDSQVCTLLDYLTNKHPPITTLSVEEARKIREIVYPELWGESEAVAQVEDRIIPGLAGVIPVRLYRPVKDDNSLPILVYFHGGGWTTCSIEAYDGFCRSLANGAGCLVVSVGYRLAPEHKFPAAVEDAYAATAWVASHASEIGGDRDRVAVGGDSCGGNLAAVVALMARERENLRLIFQLLIYPCTDYEFDRPSCLENAQGYYLTLDGMRWFWRQYLENEADAAHPYASPLRSESLQNLPPALVITAQFDPLRDQGEAYADRLSKAGVPVTCQCYNGMIHCFLSFPSMLDKAKKAHNQVIKTLQSAFCS